MASRYERSTSYQPTGMDFSRAQTAASTGQLAGRLSGVLGEFAARRSASAGARAGLKAKPVDLSPQERRERFLATPTDQKLPAISPKLKNELTAYGRAFNESARAAYMGRQQLDIEESYGRFETEAPTDVALYQSKSEGYRKGLLKGAQDPLLREQLDILARSRSAEGLRRVTTQALIVERDEQRTSILDGLDSMVQAAARKVPMQGPLADEALGVLQTRIVESLRAGQASGLFSASQVRELRNHYTEIAAKGIQSSQVDNLSSAIMGQYEADVLAGDRALAQLDQLDLPDSTRIEVQGEVRKRLGLMESERKHRYVESLGRLHQDIADGTPSANAETDAFALYRKGAMSVDGYTSMLSQIERARTEAAKKQADITAGIAAFNNSTPLDPKNSETRKVMDQVFAQAVAGVPRGSPEWQNVAIDMAARTNIAPTDSISWSRSIIAAGDPVNSATAAQFLRRMEDSNPSAFRYVDDEKLKSYVGQVNAAITAGTPEDVAIAVAYRNTYALKDSEREQLKTDYSAALKGPQKAAQANADDLQDRLDSDERYDHALLGGAPAAPVALRGEYNAAVERYYPYTAGDIEQARELAWRDVTRKWGYSTVNGAPELMPYAPEVMYPQLPMAVIKDDLSKSVAPLGLKPEEIRLIPSPETGGTDGIVWNVGHVNEYGVADIVLDERNRPLRYQLPVSEESFMAAVKALRAAEVQKAREFTERQRKMNEILREDAARGDETAQMLLDAQPKPAEGIR